MKRISLAAVCLSLLANASLADLVAPSGVVTFITSSGAGNVVIEPNGVAQLQLPSGVTLNSAIANGGILADYSTGETLIGGAVSGTGSYVKEGLGTTILTGSNTFSGYTVIDSGVLRTGTQDTLSQKSAVFIGTSGTLDLNGFRQFVGSISGSGAILMGTAALAPNSGLVKTGASLASGSNSVVGAGVVSGATLTVGYGGIGSVSVVGNGYGVSNSAGVISSNTGTGGLVLTVVGGTNSNGTEDTTSQTSGGSLVVSGSVSFDTSVIDLTGAGATLSTNNGLILSGSIHILINTALTGTMNVPITSGGSLTNMSGGTVMLAGTIALSSSSAVTWSETGGMLTFTSGTDILGTAEVSGSSFTVSRSQLRGFRSTALPELSGSGSVLITGFDNQNALYSGTISGNGEIVKTGTGVWNFTGVNTSPGMMTVADGVLLINGTTAGDVLVWGGYLGGSGVIGGSVLNESVVSPGNSPGTLVIAGDYAQASTGYLVIQIASTSVYDRLQIGGRAYLDGALVLQYLDGFTLRRGQSFAFLTAADGISGAFSQIILPDTIMGVSLTLDGTTAILNAVQGSFANDIPGLTPNQAAVARGLDRVVNSPRVAGLVDQLDGMTLSSIRRALDKIAPTDLLPMFDASFVTSDVQMDNLERRLEELRGGAAAWSCAGLHLANRPEPVGETLDPKGKTLVPATLSDRWGFFANGSGEFVDTESTGIARGADFRTGGISAGADYRLGDHAVVGAAAGYANTDSDGRIKDTVKTDSGKLGVYGSIFADGAFVNGAVGGGLESYDTQRDSIGGTARGSTDGTELNAALGTGYTYRLGGLSLGPVASVRYSRVEIDGFTERGSLAPLRYGDQSEDDLRSLLGAQVSYVFEVGKTAFRPQVRAQWKHEYLDNARSIGASFLPGGSFSVSGPDLGSNSLLLDAGFNVRVNPWLGLNLFYTGDLCRQNSSVHSINGGVDFSF